MLRSWIILQYQAEPLIDIKDICEMGRKVEMEIDSISKGRANPNKLLDSKTGLNTMIGMLISLLRRECFLNYKEDMMLLERLKDNFARLLYVLEEKEEKVTSRPSADDGRKIVMTTETLVYISEMKSILHRDFYFAIKSVLDRKPKDKNEFLYSLFETIGSNAAIFGGESRVKSKTSKLFDSTPVPMNSKILKTDIGQQKLKNEFDAKFKGYEDFEKMESVLDA